MNKKLISMLLVLVMVLSLLPIGVLAADGETAESTINEVTGRVQGPKGDEDVAVLVYGKAMSDAIAKHGFDIDMFIQTLKGSVTGILAGETLPKTEMYLVNDNNEEYKLTMEDKPSDAAFVSSIRMKSGGILGWLDDVFTFLQQGFGWLISDVDTVGEFYKIYGATDVPKGDYTLEIRKIYSDGYVLRAPVTGQENVHVGDDHVNYVGHEEYLGGHDFDINWNWWFIHVNVDVASVDFYLPGVYLDTEEPEFKFTSSDVGGNPLPGTEFLMVNRDESVKLVKAAMKFGKQTYENAMEQIDNGAFTWEELNAFNYDLLEMDTENQQINLNYEEAFKLLKTYWALIAVSADDPWKELMSTETDLRIPAILYSKADENGVVHFTEDSNVTMVWSVEILLKMANLVGKEIAEIDEKDILAVMGNFKDEPILEAILLLLIREGKELMVNGIELWNEYGDAAAQAVNDYVYPIFQNDHLLEYVDWAIELADYIPFVDIKIPEEIDTVMDYLPQHGILTKKMPAGHYVMLETEVPNGYFRNPMFYTMELIWNTEKPSPKDWCYVKLGNVGLIAPYFAEEYYTKLRELNLNTEADKVLQLINDGKTKEIFGTDTPVQDLFEKNQDTTALATYMLADLMVQVTGKSTDEGLSKEIQEKLYKYASAPGQTMQNLLAFGNEVKLATKSTVTDEINIDWKFYTPTTSLRTNAALKLKAFAQGISDAIVSDDTVIGKVNGAVKEQIDKAIDKIDTTTNRTEPYVTAAKTAAKEKVTSILSSALTKTTKLVKSTISTIAKGEKLPIFSWKK